ncbi:MAG: aminomethyltransferase family protein [Candidatus Krumholzibacteria bacterium]|nr:aminomethyltransferase family protein [Candidatus Krumholzibacteria bacterium]MDH4335864.1 aminomethyltransferase family protein [Candidatus Krumholzibacteria bacterium]MDH5270356.1 aminomethyltransferase family protein [Candidatus Krumholzibacteria bacterium]
MPIATPFHPRTLARCTSLFYKDWAGYHAVRSYDTSADREYFAFRHACGLIDVTPLYKYDVRGEDAARFLARVMVRDIMKLKLRQVMYVCWCDDDGHMIDDGTVSRLGDDHYRVTSSEPAWHWLARNARGMRITMNDVSDKIAALSIQGPTSRDTVDAACGGDIRELKFFRLTTTKIEGADVIVSRTGYTGDLGYEIWMKNDDALRVYDAVTAAGRAYGLEPAGLDAMDVTRVEAGFILNGVDYYPSLRCLIPSRKSTPYELGLGWMVKLQRDRFMGREALLRESQTGSIRKLVGLEVDWDETEALFRAHGLPPEVHPGGWRDARPVYDTRGAFIGQATSGAWSPLLKKNLALATLKSEFTAPGTIVRFEVTVEYERRAVKATVVETPFFNPERKRT